MRVGSLFSGIGGIDLGLERAGMEIVWQVENDPYCRAVLRKHWPSKGGPLLYADITDESQFYPRVDLIAGGFPCQPVSLAGKGLAQADERWLWPHFARLVRVLRPRYVIVENVPGLLARGMGDVLGDLASLGFDAEWESVPAASVGAPHIRDRVFIVGYRPAEAARWAGRERGLLADPPSGGQRADSDEQEGQTQPPLEPDAERGGQALADAKVLTVRSGFRTSGSPEQRRGRPSDRGREGDVDDATSESTGYVAGHEGQDQGRLQESARRHRENGSYWRLEPDVGRVADGVPSRMDRLRTLGNAVVPQVAEYIGRQIMTAVHPQEADAQGGQS